jgi:hypothetical protein
MDGFVKSRGELRPPENGRLPDAPPFETIVPVAFYKIITYESVHIHIYKTTQLFAHRSVGAIHESPLRAGDLQSPGNFAANPMRSLCIPIRCKNISFKDR